MRENKWLDVKYPEIRKEAHETGAKIMWADETCALAGEIRAKGIQNEDQRQF